MQKLITRMFGKSRDSSFVCVHADAFRKQQFIFGNLSRGHAAVAVTSNHCERAAGQITETARQIAIRAIDESLVAESAVLAKHHLAQTEVAHSVGRKVTMQDVEIDRVAQCLGHLAPIWIKPHAVRENLARWVDARGQQKCGPIDCVLAQNIFTNQMYCRPEFLKADNALALFVTKADRGDVVN